MLTLDGSMGEGGGQILRSAVALSMVTGTGVRIENIRARRDKPGLRRQHLTAVNAAATISRAQVNGAAVGSRELTFIPGAVEPGDYYFPIGTAGSTTLVLQTILPPLLQAAGRSTIRLEGGTHNPHAPPLNFLELAFLPIVNRLGPRVSVRLERPGFYPAGGGRLTVTVDPARQLSRFDLVDRGPIESRLCKAIVARLPRHIAERELRVVQQELDWSPECFEVEVLPGEYGPGNVLMIQIGSRDVCEVFTGFGVRGVPAEAVARDALEQATGYLDANVPVGSCLADQLLLPLALSGAGSFATLPLSLHARTNIEVIQKFLDVAIEARQIADKRWLVGIGSGETLGASAE